MGKVNCIYIPTCSCQNAVHLKAARVRF